MSEAAILEAFPRRPIQVAGAKPKSARIRNGILIFLILCLFPAWLGWKLVREHDLRADLIARGVQVDTIRTEGDCMVRRGPVSDETTGCTLEATYAVRPEDGGGERTVSTYWRGEPPILAPDTVYDPENPDRMMLAPMLDESDNMSELVLAIVGAVVALGFLPLWMLTLVRGLEVAARDPRPLFVPVEEVRQQRDMMFVKFRAPSGRTYTDGLTRRLPFVLDHPDGRRNALALMGPKERPWVLDQDLKLLDLTDDERQRIFDAADAR